MAGRIWSDRQQAVFDEDGPLQMNAVAGSGKTTTEIEKATRIKRSHPTARVKVTAFSADISAELQARVPQGVEASTLHSACFRPLAQHLALPRNGVDKKKVALMAREMMNAQKLNRRTYFDYHDGAEKLVSAAKNCGLGIMVPDNDREWVKLLNRFDVMFEGENDDEGIDLARLLFRESLAETGVIDFDDQLYMAAALNLRLPQYDYLLIDEAQDFNPIQRYLTDRMLKPGGVLISAGDRWQSIYGFRGADYNSMDLLAGQFKMREMPLDISYRCPRSVVELAQTIMPDIKASPTAVAGEVLYNPVMTLADFPSDGAVLCRNTAPLITFAYRRIAARLPVKVLGRDIGQGLVSLIRKLRAFDLQDLGDRLDKFQARETAKFLERMEDDKADALVDKCESIRAAMSHCEPDDSIDQLIAEINNLFKEDKDTGKMLTCSTVHKAKGKEWRDVTILEPQLMPSTYARTKEQQEQELHLMYVAWTRSMHTLRFSNLANLQ